MRGKDRESIIVITTIGITPAYAGKRSTIATIRHVIRDHPRLCGEKKNLLY